MSFKQQKALDFNKLLESQAQGKLLKKHLTFPLYASIKYDGNSTVTEVRNGCIKHFTSGGLRYTSTDDGSLVFALVKDGYYLAERIHGEGKLGARDRCNLRGPKSAQTSTGHNYKVFDYLTLEEYEQGSSSRPYIERYQDVIDNIHIDSVASIKEIVDRGNLEWTLSNVVKRGYEGLMLMSRDYRWVNTKSRKVSLCKYKKRRTADLLCIGITDGEGKYEGMVGALLLQDSRGRTVSAGSGLSDYDRNLSTTHIGRVYEIEFERIADTYIQPTLIRCREDKTKEDID